MKRRGRVAVPQVMRVGKRLVDSRGEPFGLFGSVRDAGTSRFVGGRVFVDVREHFPFASP
jgi:hypothetical protein